MRQPITQAIEALDAEIARLTSAREQLVALLLPAERAAAAPSQPRRRAAQPAQADADAPSRRGGRARVELTPEQVLAIRKGLKEERSINAIAADAGLSWNVVKRTIDTWQAEGQV